MSKAMTVAERKRKSRAAMKANGKTEVLIALPTEIYLAIRILRQQKGQTISEFVEACVIGALGGPSSC